jgi:hypothetical protein
MKRSNTKFIATGVVMLTTTASLGQSSPAIVCWGDNSLHQQSTPAPPPSPIRLVGSCSILRTGYLSSSGVLTLWGDGSSAPPDAPDSLTDIDQVGLGYSHGIALRRDRTVVTWGDDSYGQTSIPANLTPIVKVEAGGFFSTVLHVDGTVTCWGMGTTDSGQYPNLGQCLVPSNLSGVVTLASGDHHSMAARVDGALVGWGDNRFGQLNTPASLSGISQLAAGGLHTVVLRTNGEVICLGTATTGSGQNYDFGQCNVPIGLSDVVQVAAGNWHSAALRRDGVVVAWGSNGAGQCEVPTGLGDVVQIASGRYHIAALRSFPTIESVSPISGPSSGGTRVTILGSNFATGCEVRFDGQPATDVVVSSSSSLQATTPPNFPGESTVSVNGSSRVAFYYRPDCGSDLDQNGSVDGGDMAILLLDWGPCYAPPSALAAPAPTPLLVPDESTPAPTPPAPQSARPAPMPRERSS